MCLYLCSCCHGRCELDLLCKRILHFVCLLFCVVRHAAAKIMQPCRLYAHVSWNPKSKTWVVQRHQKYVCSHVDQHEAAKRAAKEFGVTRESLLLKNAKQTPAKHRKSMYQYVVFHARRRVWYAQCREHYVGTFATELAAARAIVDAKLATSLQELKRNKTTSAKLSTSLAVPPRRAIAKSRTRANAKKKTKAKAQVKSKTKDPLSKERFQDLWKVYRDQKGGTAKARIPGDLEDAIRGTGGMPQRFTAIHILLKCPANHCLLPLLPGILVFLHIAKQM
jgi:hypothetical protein